MPPVGGAVAAPPAPTAPPAVLPGVEPEFPATVDASQLAIFVCGPGVGETIVAHLPGGRWLVIDSCKPRNVGPLALEVLARYGVRSIHALVLTHPHRDHYRGIKEMLDTLGGVEAVSFLGVLGGSDKHLLPTVSDVDLDDGDLAVALGTADATLKRLRDSVREKKSRGVNLVRGEVVAPQDGSGFQARVLWPSETAIQKFFDHDNWQNRLRHHANDLSGVIVIESRAGGRWVLGGDLERDHAGLGWEALADDLRQHAGAKVPHHGSLGAIAPNWADIDPIVSRPRVWLLTPFSPSDLPRLEADDGAAELLKRQPAILTSALATAYVHPGTPSATRATIGRAGVVSAFASIGHELPADPIRAPASACVAGATFTPDGTCVRRFCRSGGLEILP